MDIILAKSAGFCFGVKRAVDGTFKEVDKTSKKTYCLGELVHNQDVINKIKEKGITVVENIDEIKEDNIKLIIRAHGIDKKIYNYAKNRNFEIIDFTCPLVSKIHDIANEYQAKDYYIILIGKNDHPEIIGTASHCGKNYVVVETKEELEKAINNIIKKKYLDVLVIVQTTFSKDKFASFTSIIQEKLGDKTNLVIKNTICNATETRQLEVAKIAKKVDLVIVVGGKNSSNTKKLFEIATENTNAILVESVKELDLEMIKKYQKIGIVSGASTPIEIVNEIYDKIKKMEEK